MNVIGSKPVCETYANARGLIGNNHCGREPEEMMSCSVTYNGHFVPELEWKAEDAQVLHINEPHYERHFNQFTSTAKVTADIKINGSNFVYQTRSSQYT